MTLPYKLEVAADSVIEKYIDNKDSSFSPVVELYFTPVASHNSGLTITTGTTLTPPSGASKLLIQTLTQNVRYTLEGTVPTASVGFQLRAGDPPVIIPIGVNTTIKVVQEAATASLQYEWGN